MSVPLLSLCWVRAADARLGVCGTGRAPAARVGDASCHVVEDVADGPPARDGPEPGREAHHLGVGELPQRLDGVLAAVAGIFRAAERCADDAAEVVVDES